MIRKDRPQSHSSRVQNGFMAHATQTSMSMHDLNLFPNHDIAKDWEEGEDRRKGSRSVDDQKRNMVDLQSIRKVSHSSSSLIGVRDDHDFMASIYEFRGQLVDVTFDAS